MLSNVAQIIQLLTNLPKDWVCPKRFPATILCCNFAFKGHFCCKATFQVQIRLNLPPRLIHALLRSDSSQESRMVMFKAVKHSWGVQKRKRARWKHNHLRWALAYLDNCNCLNFFDLMHPLTGKAWSCWFISKQNNVNNPRMATSKLVWLLRKYNSSVKGVVTCLSDEIPRASSYYLQRTR